MTTHILPPAIVGWANGRPDFESNPAADVSERKGTRGAPGLYDRMCRQWPVAAAHMARGRAAIEQTQVELVLPEEPDAYESAWNRRAFGWLQRNVAMQEAVGERFGVAPLLAWAHDVVWHGFGVLVPRWVDDDTPGWQGRCLLQPMLRSAIERFECDWTTLRVEAIRYTTTGASVAVPYEDCIHIAWQGQPGELFGAGELRALLGPYHVWTGSIETIGTLQRSQAGRLVLTESLEASEDDAARLDAIGEAYEEGDLSWVRLPPGVEYSFVSSSSTADFGSQLDWADAQADRVFASRNSSLVAAANGSRAIAEQLGAEDAAWALDRWDSIIADVIGAVLRWFARETGYTGTIYRAAAVRPELDTEDTASEVTTLATAVTAGLITWTDEDQTRLRERLAMEVTDAAQPQAIPEQQSYMSERLTLSEPRYRTVGRDGREVSHHMPPVEFHRDGRVYYPEQHVAWLTDEDDRRVLEELLVGEIQRIADMQRAAYAGVPNNDPAAIDAIQRDFAGQYYSVLLHASAQWRDLGRAQATEERAAQAGTDITADGPLPTAVTIGAIDIRTQQAEGALQQQARTIASRVQGEALSRRDLPSRITPAGLVTGAVSALRYVEQSAKIVEATTPRDDGMVAVAFIRTSMMDSRVCPHCRALHGQEWLFPQDETRFLQAIAQHGPPDQHCEGGEMHCRCGLVPVYGRE